MTQEPIPTSTASSITIPLPGNPLTMTADTRQCEPRMCSPLPAVKFLPLISRLHARYDGPGEMDTRFAVMSGSSVSGSTVRIPFADPYWIAHGVLHAPELASRIPCRSERGPESAG